MKNITFSADENLIVLARALARQRQTTLNEEFRAWLTQYVGQQGAGGKAAQIRALIDELTAPEADESGLRLKPDVGRRKDNTRESDMLKRLDGN